jgi:predicted RNA-binding Zn-ribbon protein involved in translation (DUF1610 family)
MSACPKGGQHTYRKVSEGGGYVTHRCTKCGDTITRKQGKRAACRADGVGWGGGT